MNYLTSIYEKTEGGAIITTRQSLVKNVLRSITFGKWQTDMIADIRTRTKTWKGNPQYPDNTEIWGVPFEEKEFIQTRIGFTNINAFIIA